MLGIALSKLNCCVAVTEYNNPAPCDDKPVTLSSVYKLLSENTASHNSIQQDSERNSEVINDNEVKIFPLDWSECCRDMNSWIRCEGLYKVEHDLVLGTDVLFTPTLVHPLLNTASILTKTDVGTCIFCMQIRCKDSHELFLSSVGQYFDSCRDISNDVYETAGCSWGKHVECLVFEMKGGKRKLRNNSMSPSTSCDDEKEHSNETSCKKRKLSNDEKVFNVGK